MKNKTWKKNTVGRFIWEAYTTLVKTQKFDNLAHKLAFNSITEALS